MVRRSYYQSWKPYVPVAARRRAAERQMAAAARDGRPMQPVDTCGGGRAIARTFWGKAWCDNLERYSDFANRLPRGRTYVRNGSVIDLRIEPGKVKALVSGSDIYRVSVGVQPLAPARWRALCDECAGGIDSLVELLQGKFSRGVMEVLCRSGTGLFPEPRQIEMSCSCPDWATMCKHVAAVLYGVGVRLDEQPELLFLLRQVEQQDLVAASAGGVAAAVPAPAEPALAGADLGELFGIELAAQPAEPPARRARSAKTTKKSGRARKPAAPVDPWITMAELRQRGVAAHVVQSWLQRGLMEHSGERGIYVRTAKSEALVRQHLRQRR